MLTDHRLLCIHATHSASPMCQALLWSKAHSNNEQNVRPRPTPSPEEFTLPGGKEGEKRQVVREMVTRDNAEITAENEARSTGREWRWRTILEAGLRTVEKGPELAAGVRSGGE